MTSQQIEYVLVLAEERSFSKASQRLYVTQPSLSQFIKNLENELCTQLFDRSTSPIRITPAGEAYIDAARKIKVIEDELRQRLADLTDLKTGILKIGTSPFRASCLLPKSIAEFHKMYPGVTIQILEKQMQDLEKAALEGTIDLYLGTGPFDDKFFYAEALAEEQLYLAVPQDSPLNKELGEYQVTDYDIKIDNVKLHRTPAVDLRRFQDEKFIMPRQGQKLNPLTIEICSSCGFEPKVILYSERMETAFSWTLAGIGISLLPDFLIRFGNYEKHPVYYKINHPKASRHLCIAHRRNRYLSRVSVEYIALLKRLIGYGTWQFKE
jgi:DNA-binding transcriptional LysR family regulator